MNNIFLLYGDFLPSDECFLIFCIFRFIDAHGGWGEGENVPTQKTFQNLVMQKTNMFLFSSFVCSSSNYPFTNILTLILR
jgi:hypothetical protein